MKKILFLLTVLFTVGATAQTLVTPNNIVKATNGSLLLQGTNAAGVATQSVAISNVGHISGRSMDLNGADGISAQKLTLSNGGAITGSNQFLTLDAVGNGNVVIKDQTTIEGNLKVNQTISSSQAIQTTGTGSISSAYNLSAASNKFKVAGDTGNVSTAGTVSATNFGTNSGKFYVNGTNGNTTVHGVSLLFGGAYVGPRADDSSQPALTVNGQGAFKGISNAGQKITGVGNGTEATDAVNKSQLDGVQDNLDVEVTRLDKRIDDTNTTIENNKVEAAKATAKVQTNLDAESVAREKADKEIYGSISQTNANLDKEIATRKLEVARLDTRIDGLVTYVGNEFKLVNNRMEGLGAMTAALSAAATSSIYNASKPTNLNIATGFYGRASALAVGVSHFFNSNTKVSVNWSQGSATKSAVGIGAGFVF